MTTLDRSDGATEAPGALEIVSGLVAMVVLAVSGAGMAVALVALLYTGPLIDGRPRATAGVLVAGGVGVLWLALRSRIVPMVAIPQDAPAVVLVAVVAAMIAANPALGTNVGEADWVMVLLAVATLLSGLLMWVLGRFGLGEAVRYLPTVVVNAFVAGTGWLLVKGGFGVMVGADLGLGDLADLFDGATVARWSPGLALALLVFGFGVSRRIPAVAVSVVVVAAVVVFYLIVSATSSVGAVEGEGWLVGPFERPARPAFITPNMLGDFPWSAILDSPGEILSLLVITLVALLLNLSALESTRRERVDTGHELRETGLANMVASSVGAVPVFHGLGDSLLAEQIGVRRRWVAVGVGLLLILFGLVGAAAVGFVPVFIAGGLLVAVGLNLLAGWVGFLSGPIGWTERLLSGVVLAIIMTVGILEGVVFGLILACALFVFRYSRVDPIRRRSDLSITRSRTERTAEDVRTLDANAGQVHVFELQGYLFFGLTTRLVDAVRSLIAAPEADVRTVVFDLRFVTGLEPGTAGVIGSLFEELAEAGVEPVISGIESGRAVAFAGPNEGRTFDTLDVAMATVEDELLVRSAEAASTPSSEEAADLVDRYPWLERFTMVESGPGEFLIAEGDPGDTLLYLLSGTCSVYSTSSSGDRHRVRQFVGPSWVGEIGFLRAAVRSADVVSESDIRYATIDRDGFDRLRTEDPGLAADLLHDIATVAADRTASMTDALTRALD